MSNTPNTDRRDISENRPAVPWGLVPIFVGLIATLYVSSLIGTAFQEVARRTGHDPAALTGIVPVFFGLVGGWIGFFGTAVVVSRRHGGLAQQIGLRFDLPTDLWKGILTGLAAQFIAVVVYLPLQWIAPDLVDSLGDPAKDLTGGITGWQWVVLILFVSGVTPFAEESFFRGVALRGIAGRFGWTAGIIGSALLFGLIHFQALQTLALVLLGALLAWRARRTGRIGECIVAHATFNLVTSLTLFLSSH